MKIPLIILLLVLISGCASREQFPHKDVCFLLYDLKTDAYSVVMNDARCKERFPAASTFKVPLAVMAFDAGILKNETSPEFKWNGEVTPIPTWNKNHNPTSWMRDSVVWISQEITPKIGMDKIQKYLADFEYGNQDFSAGLKYSWLTPAPFIREPMQNSLKISGYEQVNFLKKLWRGELKASPAAQKMTKALLSPDVSPRGNTIIGKTGSGFFDENHDMRLGWYIGLLQSEKSEYVVVINFSDKQKQPSGTFGGREAKEIALKLLTDKGLW